MKNIHFDHFKINFTVPDRLGNIIHRGSYWLDDDQQRRAFGQRCHEAIRDGFVIASYRDMEEKA